jgi:hypothetical protein
MADTKFIPGDKVKVDDRAEDWFDQIEGTVVALGESRDDPKRTAHPDEQLYTVDISEALGTAESCNATYAESQLKPLTQAE